MENEKNKPDRASTERRSGEDRRKFSFGYAGKDRRKTDARRKKDRPSE